MNSRKCILQRFSILVVVLSASAFAFAGRGPQKSSQEHKSAPSKPASHSAPAQHSTGHTSSGGHTTTPGHAANSSHTTSGGHTATAGHSTVGGHTATTGHASPGGHTTTVGHTPAGVRNVSLKGGGSASIRSNGQVRSVDRGGMHIDHGVNGGRTVVSEHNGVRVVNTGRNGGYVQRAYVNRGGHSYYSRTYYAGGSYHTGVYRGYYWGGHAYYGFHAGFWFHPGFYGWGYHPWGAPLYWGVGLWGWGGSPWWGFYGGWFTPYPYYAGPAYWLTDYLVAQELQSAYAARQEAAADAVAADASAASYGDGGGSAPAASASSTVTLSPEVKEAIADEVKAELAAQQAEAAQNGSAQTGSAQAGSPAPNSGSDAQVAAAPANSSQERPPALDPARRTFVVDSNLTVTANGQECGLTGGDVLTRLTDTPDADNLVTASVSASKKSDCAAGQTVSVKVDDLQEMQNHFDEQLDNGMKELAKKQGTDGMPKAPDTAVVESDIPPPQPDTTAEKTLQDQQQAADQAETQVKQEATAAPAPNGGQQ
jgi:hypothetical protein